MSSTEPPAGSTPPPGEPTSPPPPEMPANPVTMPPPDQSMAPPPPPPPPGAAAPMAAGPAAGVGQPGTLVDRFLAKLIDGVILGVVYVIINVIVGAIVYSGYHSTGEVFVFYLIVGVIDTILYLGYFSYMESSRGQTIGKQVMKLKVFGPDGASNPTMEQAVRRNIYYAWPLIMIIPVLGWFLGPILAVAAAILILVGINGDPKRQHWFDKFAGGTQVTKIG